MSVNFPVFAVVIFSFLSWLPVMASENGSVGVYSDQFHGRPTASGGLYDVGLKTAAHATLPFGTWVRVANFDTGRMVDVQVNDRKGPDGCILKLSRAAAEAIQLPSNSVAPGSLMVIQSAPVTPPTPVAGYSTAAPVPALLPGVQGAVQSRKFQPFAGLFGKNSAVASQGQVPGVAMPTVAAASPVASGGAQYSVPAAGYQAPLAQSGGGLFKSGKIGGLFSGKSTPTVPANQAMMQSRGLTGMASPGELIQMNAQGLPQRGYPGTVPGYAAAPGYAAQPAPMPSLAPPVAAATLPMASPGLPYRAQFGAFRRAGGANEMAEMLGSAGIPTSVYVSPATGMNVVVTNAGFRSADEAQRWIDFEGARRGWSERPVVVR